MIRLAIAAALLVLAGPAAAAGYQYVFDFEDLGVGTTTVKLGAAPVNTGTGGTVATSAAAHSGTKVYAGTTLDFVVENEIDYDWPAVGGWITGADAVTLTAWHYNPDTGTEDLAGTAVTGPSPSDAFLGIGTDMAPVRITKWQFASTSAFTLDDLTLGLVDVPGGIPEPAAWGLMVVGFGVVGGRMRRRGPSVAA